MERTTNLKSFFVELATMFGIGAKLALILVIPVFIVIWIVEDRLTAWSYAVYVSLVISFGFPLLIAWIATLFEVIRGRGTSAMELINPSVLIMLLFVAFIAWFKLYYIEVVVRQADIAARVAKQAAYKPPEDLCRDIGVRYGRASAKALQGQTVRASEDAVIPERCRNDPSTAKGIQIGTRLQLTGQ